MRANQQSGQAFPSLLKRRWSQVRLIQGEKVERKQAGVLRRLRPQPVEVGGRGLAFENGLAVQDDAVGRHCPERLHNERERRRPTQAVTAAQPHALAVLAGNDRYPSCLISLCHCGPEGATLASVGMHGAIKPGGLRRLRAGLAFHMTALSEPAVELTRHYPSCLT